MILWVRPPCATLQPFIDHFVLHDGYVSEHTKELLLPDGGIDMIIDLAELPKHLYQNENWRIKHVFHHGWISGMRMERITIQASIGTPMLVVRFKPGGAWPFFNFPISELSDRVIPLADIWGPIFFELREQLLEAPHYDNLFPILESFLLGLGQQKLVANPFVTHAIATLESTVSPPTMKQLANHLGFSHKHVIALFDRLVGISPKRYTRILRFQKMVLALERGKPESWSQFAQEFGVLRPSPLH